MANVIQFTVRAKDENSSRVFGGITKAIGGIVAAIGGLAAGRAVAGTVVEFEKLRLSINTVSKSAADARANMGFIEKFAATTPFDLNQVTDSFIKLKALGLDPSEDALRSYGNTASAMGKSLNQMIEAVADASVGEFERLKEFGIKARNEGDTIKFTFQGVTTEVANNAQAIEAHLRGIGNTTFAGAMETQANSVVGAVSNMKDSFVRLGVALGDAGIRPLIRQAALAITAFIDKIIEHKGTIRDIITNIVTFGLVLKQVFVSIVGGIRKLFEQDLATSITSLVDMFKKVGTIIIDWAAAVVPAMAKIFLTGIPIMLRGITQTFIDTFLNIGQLIGHIIAIALTSIVKTFKAFGEAINDEIQQAFFGEEAASFADNLSNRFSEAFAGALQNSKALITSDVAEIGGDIVDGIVNTVTELKDKVGPVISESAGEIVTAYDEAGAAMGEMFGVNMESIRAQAEAMTEGLSAFRDKANEITGEQVETHESAMQLFRDSWQTFIDDQGSIAQAFAKTLQSTAKATSKSIGQAFASTVVEGKNLMKGLEQIGKAVLKTLISTLVELGVQRLILAATTKAANIGESSAGVAKAAALVFSNQMASMSGAPFPINLTAPAVASAMTGVALSGAAASGASGAALGASIAGVAHGGLDYVPNESTFLLQRGERVLSPRQNTDLTDFLAADGGGRSVTVESIQLSVLENVTSLDNFMNMTNEEVKEIVAGRIITALDQLDAEGIRPAFADRGLNT